MPMRTVGELNAGDVIGKNYEVQEVLGRGGNAVTYKVGLVGRCKLAILLDTHLGLVARAARQLQ
jgi:hypothetical protein